MSVTDDDVLFGPPIVSHIDCAKCSKDIYIRPRKNLYHVKCVICNRYLHVYCVLLPYNRRNDLMHSNDWYMCDDCSNLHIPFNTLDDLEFKKALYISDLNDLDVLPDLNNVEFLSENSLDDPLSVNIDQSFIPGSSKYFMPCEFHTRIDKFPDYLSILHVNLNSLNEKTHENLCDLIIPLRNKVSIIAVSETRLKSKSDTSNLNIPGYLPLSEDVRHDSDTFAGGVCLYVKDNIRALPRSDLKLNMDGVENLWFEIEQPKKNVILGLIYRHPRKLKNEINEFTEKLDLILQKINHEKKLACVTGDINLNLLNYENSPGVSDYLNMLFTNHFFPTVTRPTRIVPHHTPSLIDHFYYNSLDTEIETGVITYPISDGHLPIFSIIHTSPSLANEDRYFRCYKNFNEKEFIQKLKFSFSDFIEKSKDIDCPNFLYNEFLKTFYILLNQEAPYRKMRRKEIKLCSKPWITKGILKSLNNKVKLYKNFFLSGNIQQQNYYRKYCNVLTRIKEKSKVLYYENSFEKLKSDSKKTWKLINSIVNIKPKNKSSPKLIKANNCSYNKPEEIANKFNHFFRNVGPNLAKNIPNSEKNFSEYLSDPVQNTFQAEPCTRQEIIKLIKDLKSTKSLGLDLIPTKIIKIASEEIATPLMLIFNLSFSKGIFPDKLKKSKIIPIYKSESHFELTNYRPISILPCLSKILERLMYNRLTKFLIDNDILYKFQFGFRKDHSTNLALLEITDTIYKNLDDGNFIFSLYVDLSKAFDTVNFEILFHKLEHYGIRGQELDWFKSYVSKRSQSVEINNSISEPLETICGVPQGSNLGPLLFLIYINDLPNASDILNFRLFADDTKIYFISDSLYEIQDKIDTEFPKVSDWFNSNKLSLNIKKTHYVLYKPLNKQEPLTLTLILNNELILRKDHAKYLGLYFDDKMSWDKQITALTLKLSKAIGILYKLKRYASQSILRNVYYSIIHPHLIYGIMSWGATSITSLNSLQGKQNRALKLVFDLPWRLETNPIYFNNKFLKINELYHLELIRFMYKFYHNLLPPAFSLYFTKIETISPYNTRLASNHNFRLPAVNRNYGLKSQSYTGIKLWSQIPTDAKFINYSNFKTFSFNHMLSRYNE